MATITRKDSNLLASPRLRVAAGIVRPSSRLFHSDNVLRWAGTRQNIAGEVDAAYAEQAEIASERADLVEAFVAARGDWTAELRVLAKARRFDDAHPSRDPLYDELHADQLYGTQYPEAA